MYTRDMYYDGDNGRPVFVRIINRDNDDWITLDVLCKQDDSGRWYFDIDREVYRGDMDILRDFYRDRIILSNYPMLTDKGLVYREYVEPFKPY